MQIPCVWCYYLLVSFSLRYVTNIILVGKWMKQTNYDSLVYSVCTPSPSVLAFDNLTNEYLCGLSDATSNWKPC